MIYILIERCKTATVNIFGVKEETEIEGSYRVFLVFARSCIRKQHLNSVFVFIGKGVITFHDERIYLP